MASQTAGRGDAVADAVGVVGVVAGMPSWRPADVDSWSHCGCCCCCCCDCGG